MVLDIVLWILVIASIAVAFVALVYPILPGIPFLWLGALIYSFGIADNGLHFTFWIFLILFTAFFFAVDIISNRFFLRQTDVSKLGDRLSIPAVIVGSFVIPPFGLLIVPFIVVVATELLHKKPLAQAIKIAWATVISFLTSSAAKLLMLVIFVVVFGLYAFVSL